MSAAPPKPKTSSSKRDKDDSANPDLQLNSVGNYTFQKTVGEGNFAKVKLAIHKMTGQEVGAFWLDVPLTRAGGRG